MTNPRKYGIAPYKIALIHGGPGAPGYMAPVARELSNLYGIIEPLQTKDSIDGQVEELNQILSKNAEIPLILIGHSWGAMLAIIFNDKYPEIVKKLILIGSGPFEIKYIDEMKMTRKNRLNEQKRDELRKLEMKIKTTTGKEREILWSKFGKFMTKIDSYEPIPSISELLEDQPDIHEKVWREALKLREEGKFIVMIKKITCPVIAIHGIYDYHPYKAVQTPFNKYVKDFRFILLEKCGHEPWLEKYTKDKFYEILQGNL